MLSMKVSTLQGSPIKINPTGVGLAGSPLHNHVKKRSSHEGRIFKIAIKTHEGVSIYFTGTDRVPAHAISSQHHRGACPLVY